MEEFLIKFKNSNISQGIGHAGLQTEASKNALFLPKDADNTGVNEFAERLKRQGKKLASAELKKANEEWTKRNAAAKNKEIEVVFAPSFATYFC